MMHDLCEDLQRAEQDVDATSALAPERPTPLGAISRPPSLKLLAVLLGRLRQWRQISSGLAPLATLCAADEVEPQSQGPRREKSPGSPRKPPDPPRSSESWFFSCSHR